MQKILIKFIVIYQYLISPLVGASCRFTPTCSDYAIDAVNEHGALLGILLAVKRLGRCHPWHEGGVDPVPPAAEPEQLNKRRCHHG